MIHVMKLRPNMKRIICISKNPIWSFAEKQLDGGVTGYLKFEKKLSDKYRGGLRGVYWVPAITRML